MIWTETKQGWISPALNSEIVKKGARWYLSVDGFAIKYFIKRETVDFYRQETARRALQLTPRDGWR